MPNGKKGKSLDIHKYIKGQIAYFKRNASSNGNLLGVEFEHFLVDKDTLRSYSYFEPGGQRDIVKGLINNKKWNLISQENGYPLGLEKDGSTITFEPGGQMEISLKPLVKVSEIKEAYEDIIEDIYSEMSPNQILTSIGYHPKTKIAELPILPKNRYQIMFDYFKTHGAKSHNMMKGTAATQVSIDYSNEEDFIKKYRVAHFIAPVLASLFDSSPIFEGELYAKENLRVAIWEETDPPRSKLVPGVLDTRFDFEGYAKYLLEVPPIFIVKDGVELYTKETPLKELLAKHQFTEKELEHIMSMVFPDVRVKKFIEIRMADALPYPYGLAVVEMIKGIFYTTEVLDELYEKSLLYNDDWVLEQNRGLIEDPVKVDNTFLDLKKTIIEESLKLVSEEENIYLQNFFALINEHGSISNWLKNLYINNLNLFKETIAVPRRKGQ